MPEISELPKVVEYIGYVAAFLTTSSFIPQAFQTIKTKNTDGISLLMYLMFVIGVLLWIFYAILIDNKIIIVSNSIIVVLSGIILITKICNLRAEKNKHLGKNLRR